MQVFVAVSMNGWHRLLALKVTRVIKVMMPSSISSRKLIMTRWLTSPASTLLRGERMTTINGKACVANGRNLLLDTNFDNLPQYWTARAGTVTGTFNGHNVIYYDAQNITGNLIDVLQQPIYDPTLTTNRVSPSQWYTLSFYAKGVGQMTTYVYGSFVDSYAGGYVDGAKSGYMASDGSNVWDLTDDWTRHTYTIKSKSSFPATGVQNVLFRAFKGNEVYICMPKLEAGTLATPLTPAPVDKVFSNGRQVYGRNLLLNTGDFSGNWSLNGILDTSRRPAVSHYPKMTLTTAGATNMIANQQLNDGLLQPSTTYTASFYAKGSGTFRFFCYPGVAATAISVNGIVVSSTSSDCDTSIPLASNYARYTITFTTLSSISGSKNFLLRQDYNSSDTSFNTVEAYVYGMKLEKGSVATPYSQAPEDILN